MFCAGARRLPETRVGISDPAHPSLKKVRTLRPKDKLRTRNATAG